MKFSSIKLRSTLPLQILVALVLGFSVGHIFGSRTRFLGEMGLFVVRILRVLASPLVFFAIIDAFFQTPIKLKDGLRLAFYSVRNGLVALLISFTLAYVFPLPSDSQILKMISTDTGSSGQASAAIWNALSPNILWVIGTAIILGIGGRLLKSQKAACAVEEGLKIVTHCLQFILFFIPFAVFAVVAKLVGAGGLKYFSTLGIFVALVAAGIGLHVFIYYGLLIKILLKKSPLTFFRTASPALLTSLGTGSSLATLPVTLETLQDKMKTSSYASRLSACIGTNFNHDGILLYEATAALFVAQVQGIHLSLYQKMSLSLTSVLAAVGIAGVPDAGLITLSLVLTAAGLPLNWVTFLLPVDWLLGRLRAMANVASDMVVAQLLDS